MLQCWVASILICLLCTPVKASLTQLDQLEGCKYWAEGPLQPAQVIRDRVRFEDSQGRCSAGGLTLDLTITLPDATAAGAPGAPVPLVVFINGFQASRS